MYRNLIGEECDEFGCVEIRSRRVSAAEKSSENVITLREKRKDLWHHLNLLGIPQTYHSKQRNLLGRLTKAKRNLSKHQTKLQKKSNKIAQDIELTY
jgi:hypothetical protein